MGLFEVTDEELYQDEIRRPLAEKIEIALARIREYEQMALELSEHGYYVAFSGGKDSIVLERLFKMSGVKYAAWYNNVTIDPPELVRFIKDFYPEVKWNNPKEGNLPMFMATIGMPPTRIARWCCEIYKEQGGNGLFKAVGVRGEESQRRKSNWSFLSSRRGHSTPILCPLIHWTDRDIWTFILLQKMNYCKLYDEGFKRLGCIGCPMARKGRIEQFRRWPKYEKMWRNGFNSMFNKYKGKPKKNGKPRSMEKFKTAEEWFDWWMSDEPYQGDQPDCQGFLW